MAVIDNRHPDDQFALEALSRAMTLICEVRAPDLYLILFLWLDGPPHTHHPAKVVLCHREWGASVNQIFWLNKVLPYSPFRDF